MELIPDSDVLDALYREANTRRRTADTKQADLLATEQAARDASKLGAESNVLLCKRLRRDVESAFNNHCCVSTGLLTKVQLQAVLHDLGLLENKPAAFSSSSPARPLSAVSPHSSRHAQQQAHIVNRLWTCLHATQPPDVCVHQESSSSPQPNASPDMHSHHTDAASHDAGIDALLREGLDAWEQLIGFSPSDADLDSPQSRTSVAVEYQASQLSTAVHMHVDEAFRTAHSMQSHAAASKQRTTKTTGVSMQQLLNFVQLVQQCSSIVAIQLLTEPVHSLAQHQAEELDRLARICSRNRQNNMAYIGIGKTRTHRQPLAMISSNTPTKVTIANAARQTLPSPVLQGAASETKHWRPSGHTSASPAADKQHSSSIRFSRRWHRHQLARQQAAHTAIAQPVPTPRPRSRAFSYSSSQPFACSSLTARQVQKHRQAQAEQEMVPCTFHPSLDPHSLALVARLTVPYKPPHKAASPHSQYLQPFTCAAASGRQATACMRVSSAGSDSGSAAETAAAASGDGSPHDSALLLGSGLLTSWECRQQQAMQECTFSPQLSTNTKRSKSVVARVWKPSPTARVGRTITSTALQASGAEGAPAADREGASKDSHSPASSSSASTGPKQATLNPQFVTAPMHHEAARAQHRHLVSYAAAGAAATVSSQCAAVVPDAGADETGPGKQEMQLQQAGAYAGVVGRELSADEAELQAALLECDRQQRLLQTRWHRKHGCSAGKQSSSCSAADARQLLSQGSLQQEFEATISQEHDIPIGQQAQRPDDQHHPVIKIALEATLPDGSSSRFDVQQGDKLRHLTKYFAAMLDLSGGRSVDTVAACL